MLVPNRAGWSISDRYKQHVSDARNMRPPEIADLRGEAGRSGVSRCCISSDLAGRGREAESKIRCALRQNASGPRRGRLSAEAP
jgi:hypothetical protein